MHERGLQHPMVFTKKQSPTVQMWASHCSVERMLRKSKSKKRFTNYRSDERMKNAYKVTYNPKQTEHYYRLLSIYNFTTLLQPLYSALITQSKRTNPIFSNFTVSVEEEEFDVFCYWLHFRTFILQMRWTLIANLIRNTKLKIILDWNTAYKCYFSNL